jgi:hypothetical protein
MGLKDTASKTINNLVTGRGFNSFSGEDLITGPPKGYEYITGIVGDVITDPSSFISDFLVNHNPDDENESAIFNKKFKNSFLKDMIPVNSVTAYIIDDAESLKDDRQVFCFPFFSPHISLPIKPGEYVWLLRESYDNIDIYYWLSRKHGIRFVDDVNYTNLERTDFVEKLSNLVRVQKKISASSPNKNAYIRQLSRYNKLPNDDYDSNLPENITNDTIVNDSVSYNREFTQEPVPNIQKKCGDTIIQGSNNSVIQLTTEKFLLGDESIKGLFKKSTNNNENRNSISPAIDICVFRKKNELLELSEKIEDINIGDVGSVLSVRDDVDLEAYEIDKISEIFDDSRKTYFLDVDATNCGSRLYMSNNCSIDDVFNIAMEEMNSLAGPSLASYTTHNRVIGKSSARIINKLGQTFIDMDVEGNIKIKAMQGGAYIKLKKNGDIAIVPGENGVLLLGGEDLEAVSTPLLQTAIKTGGTVAPFSPIISTMGGTIGLEPPNVSGLTGTFSSKVLIR